MQAKERKVVLPTLKLVGQYTGLLPLWSRTDEAAQTSHLSPSRGLVRKLALASQRTAYVTARNWAKADASASGEVIVESACMT